MSTAVLSVHISVALFLFLVIAASFGSMYFNFSKYYKHFTYILSIGLIIEALSGCLVELSMAHPALFAVFCSKILFYMGAIVVTQVFLMLKMKKININLSYNYISYPSLIALISVGITGLIVR